jgi:SAM-dependent methyltransferase
MLKYLAYAVALKALSATAPTRALYRSVANNYWHLVRAPKGGNRDWLIAMHENRVQPGDHLLDLGTGWIHRNAIDLRNQFEVRITCLDVIDNRQLDGLRERFANYKRTAVIEACMESRSFEELYERLGFHYVLDPNGSLDRFPDNHFQTIFSMNTLEHVPRAVIRQQVNDSFRILRPGGYAIHRVDLSDHLSKYDKGAGPRRFLSWDSSWRLLFENRIQYVNRLMPSDFRELFTSAGFVVEIETMKRTQLNGQKVAEPFRHYSRADLECVGLELVYRKP